MLLFKKKKEEKKKKNSLDKSWQGLSSDVRAQIGSTLSLQNWPYAGTCPKATCPLSG